MLKRMRYLVGIVALMFGVILAPPASASPDPLSCYHGSTEINWHTRYTASQVVYQVPSRYALTNFCLHGGLDLLTQPYRRIIWQYDGNLTVRSGEYAGGSLLFSAGTQGRGRSLTFASDGTIDIKDAYGNVISQLGYHGVGNFGWQLYFYPPTGQHAMFESGQNSDGSTFEYYNIYQ